MSKKKFYDTTKKLIVKRSRLHGRVSISGAKNSALKLLTGSLLTDDDIIIFNCPTELIDVQIHIEMLNRLGKICTIFGDTVNISTDKALKEELIWDGPSIRNTLLIFGAILTRKGRSKVPLPGGCSIGDRKYDLHQMVLEKLGAKVWVENECLYAEAPTGLIGTDITLPIRSTGATENAIISGALARGTTTIWGPHIRPEVIDLINYMRSMGAKIEVFGQESIRINGVDNLHGTRYRTIPDNMEALTYLIAAAITRGEIEIENFPYDNLEVPLVYLRESGTKLFRGEENLIVRSEKCYPIEISTGPYPGINSDMQPLFAVYGLCAKGQSRITDLRFPERFGYTEELKKLGGKISVTDNILFIEGGEKLKGTNVIATDLRCGASLILAGFISEGTTRISNSDQINRGYEHIEKKLQFLGGNIYFDSIDHI